MAGDKDVLEILGRSIAPTIEGSLNVKKGILL
jgi:DNA replicative helicase MCM subunit Mcm2 (Cdc46/Mcm family)